MILLKWLFGSRKPALNKPVVTSSGDEIKSKYDGFDIEHLPHADRYFPRYKGKYFYWWNTRYNYSLENDISGCAYGSNIDEAKK